MINDFIETARLIAKFQALETGLKVVLVQHQMETDKKNNSLKSLYSLRDVDDIPYGLLLKRHRKISKDDELYNRLSILKDYRNYLAHKSLLSVSSMPEETKKFIGVYLKQPLDYQELNLELDECILLFSKIHSSAQV